MAFNVSENHPSVLGAGDAYNEILQPLNFEEDLSDDSLTDYIQNTINTRR